MKLRENQNLMGVYWECDECLSLALNDTDLITIIRNWDQLPKHIKQTITTIADAQINQNLVSRAK